MPSHPDNRNRRPTPQPSTEFCQVLKYEMAMTAETMNQELSELQIMGYVEALSGLSIEKLRAGFKRARRTLQFFPKPVEVWQLALDELEESAPKQYFLPEPEPVWSDEDRATWLAEIRKACNLKPKYKPPTEQEIEQRRQTLQKQAEELKAKSKTA